MIWQWISMYNGLSLHLVDSNNVTFGGVYQNIDGTWSVGTALKWLSVSDSMGEIETCLKQSDKWTDGDVILPFGGADYVVAMEGRIAKITNELGELREELRNLKKSLAEAVR